MFLRGFTMHLTRRSNPALPDDSSVQLETASADTIGLLLRRFRTIRRLSQEDLAKLSHANLSYINTIENHPSNLSIKKLMEICRAMDIPCSLLMRLLEQDNVRQIHCSQ